MRFPKFLGALSLPAVLLVACDGQALAGPQVPPVSLAEAPQGQAGLLILLDGKPITFQKLKQLNASEISMIEVVKGPTAIRLYGEAGRAGVVQVYSKAKTSGR